MDTDIFIVYIKTEEKIYVDIAKKFEKIFDTSSYEFEMPLPRG